MHPVPDPNVAATARLGENVQRLANLDRVWFEKSIMTEL